MTRTLPPLSPLVTNLLAPLVVIMVAMLWPWTRSQPSMSAVVVLAGMLLAWASPAWSLVLLALVAPFETALEMPVLGTVYTSELLLLAFVPGWFWNGITHPSWRKPLAPVWWWAAPFLVLLFSQLLIHPASVTIKATLRWLEFFMVLLAGVHWLRRPGQAWAVWWALLLAFSLNSLMGLGQTWQGRLHWPGLLTWSTAFGEVVRASGEYGPNTLAGVIALVLPLGLAFFLFHPSQAVKRLSYVLVLLLAAGLAATFSVIGYTSAALGVVFLALMLNPKPRRMAVYAGLLVLLGLTLVVALNSEAALAALIKIKSASLADRLGYMQVAGHLLAGHPWWGIGPGWYKTLALTWRHQELNIIGLITHPHALWLLVLVENGILGLAALLWGLGQAASYIIRKAAHRRNPMLWAACAGLVAVAFLNLGEQGLVHDRGVHVALALAATLVLVTKKAFPQAMAAKHCFEHQWRQHGQHLDWAKQLEERRQGRQVLYKVLDQALAGPRPAKVLELGCGPALDALHLSQRNRLDVHGLDSSPAALQLAREASQKVQRPLTLHHGDARCTGLAAQSFDLIFSQGLLEHFKDPDPVWQEMDRLLKPGGAVVVDVPQTFNPYTLIKWGHRLKGTWPWGWETQYTLGQLKRAGQILGWKVKTAHGYGYRQGAWDITYRIRQWAQPYCPRWWARMEQTTGAWWMMNVVVLFEKGKCS